MNPWEMDWSKDQQPKAAEPQALPWEMDWSGNAHTQAEGMTKSQQKYAADDAATKQANKAAPWYEQLGTGVKTQAGRTMLGMYETLDNLDKSVPLAQLGPLGSGLKALAAAARNETGGDREVLAEAQREADRRDAGTGVAGAVGNIAGDFRNYLPVGKAMQAAKAKTVGEAIKQGATIGAKTGALSGLTEGTGAANSTIADNLKNAAIGTAVGATAGAAVPAVVNTAKGVVSGVADGVKNAAGGIVARGGDELADVAANLKSAASTSYQNMRNAGAVLKNQSVTGVLNRIDAEVAAGGKLNAGLHGDFLSVMDDIRQAAKSGNLSLEELDQYRQLLSDVVKKNTSKIDGMNPAGEKATRAIRALDDAVDNLGVNDLSSGSVNAFQSLSDARGQWQKFRKFERISELIQKADGDPNRLKSSLQKFVDNKNNLRGYSQAEREALIDAAKNSVGEKLLKGLGKFGIDLGGSLTPGNTALPVISTVLGAPGLTAAGTVARQAQKYVGRGKADQLLNVIETGVGKAPRQSSPVQLPAAVTRVLANEAAQATVPTQQPTELPQVNLPTLGLPPEEAPAPQSNAAPLLQRMAMAESGGNPNARNTKPNVTAAGLLGFNDDTWTRAVHKWGKPLGITLKDKMNPEAQLALGEKLMEDNAKIIGKFIGRELSDGELYIAHALGAPDAKKLLAAQGSGREAITLFPRRVVDSNREWFFAGKRPRTVEQVYEFLSNKV